MCELQDESHFNTLLELQKCYRLNGYVTKPAKSYMPMVSHQASLFLGRRVTVEPVQNYDIPTYYYNFATFDILDSRKTHPKQLTDFIGRVDHVSPILLRKEKKTQKNPNSGNPLEITLWGEKSNLIQPETALGKAIVVTATIVTQYEFKQLESTVSTTVELNPNFPELQSYIDRFNQLPAAEEEEPVLETLTIAELLDKGKNATQKRGKFICNAKITTAQEYRGWFYVKCSGYGKSAYEEDDNFVCAHCPVPKEPNIRYSLNTIIADNTSTIEAIFFDESLHSLLGVSCKTLVMNKNNKNPKIFPPEIHHIINVPLTLTVNIKPDGTLSVDKAKANNTATTSETARMSERETITPATSILKDYSSISEITPSTPNPKIIRDKRAPSSQTVVISCDQEHIWSHIIRAIQELHQKIMSYIEELKHLQIPLQDISSATNDFSKENYIGLGGFGKVYKGVSEKHGIIAIKRLDRDRGEHSQGDHEFKTEIALLSNYEHENIVTFHGFCDEEGEKILVYSYESRGSLDRHLTSTDLTWTQRLRICLDVACGLRYLHDDVAPQHRTLHRDVKSANILLDENWKAKICDFGLSRKGPADMQSSFVISNACGTLGYIDPEYFYTGHLTPKSDVFSFGVVLFEVLCKRPAFVTVNGQFFYVWVQKHYKRRKLDEIIHSDLHEQINPASLLTFSTVAYQCLSIGEERPTMKEVAEQLQRALDNQLAPSRPRSNAYNDDDFAARYQRHSRGASSSQPSPAISQPRKYDVFLSFRGEDTRKSFVDHLYSSLVQQLEIFKDDEALTRGELIGASLFKSIKESKIAIVVFSKNYASSSWCLDELKYIMECRVETGLIVIPVFYDVDPSDVRRQSGPYAEAFSKHKSKNTEKFESWRKALVDAASISGFVITGSEAKAIQEIVYTVTHRLLSLMPSDEVSAKTSDRTGLIGIKTRTQHLRSLLEIGSGGVRMVGICGIWGSGKSTLASSIYDEIRHEFEGCCFIKNVCTESRLHGLKKLQEKILSDVFKSEVTLRSIEQGINIMKRRLCQNSVLIVLDDVDHLDHLQMLAGSPDWFGEGSRIIITTRNQDLVNAHNCITQNVRMLDIEEAIKLFSWHAFGASRPVEGYEELSRSIVSKLGGHPLAVKSLGSFLHDKGMIYWMSTLAKLQGIPVDVILERFNCGDDGINRDIFSWLAA